MEKTKKVLDRFNPEELEQRYEMGWQLKKVDYKIQTEHGTIEGEIK